MAIQTFFYRSPIKRIFLLKDVHGRKIGEIEETRGKKIIRNEHGHKLGEFDDKVTKNEHGRIVGYGDLLTTLLK